jgi:hypothetical protein
MKKPVAILIAVIITAVFFVSSLSFGEAESNRTVTFDRNLQYDVYYAVSDFEAHVVRQVTIEGTASLASREYLVVRGTRVRSTPSAENSKGYIPADSVRAILPSEMPKPERLLRADEH